MGLDGSAGVLDRLGLHGLVVDDVGFLYVDHVHRAAQLGGEAGGSGDDLDGQTGSVDGCHDRVRCRGCGCRMKFRTEPMHVVVLGKLAGREGGEPAPESDEAVGGRGHRARHRCDCHDHRGHQGVVDAEQRPGRDHGDDHGQLGGRADRNDEQDAGEQPEIDVQRA